MSRPRLCAAALCAALLSLPTPARAGLLTLASFNGPNGRSPTAPVVMDDSGNLYGTTSGGGSAGEGTVFKLSPNGTLTTLVNFDGDSFPDGASPYSGLIRDRSGNLYGATWGGGYPFQAGYGTIFKISPNGTLTYLFNNFNGFTNGAHPSHYGTGLVMDGGGNFYGTTEQGGASGTGTVFELSPNGTLTTLASLGGNSFGGLLRDSSGNLYGTTHGGGSAGDGTVFKLSPDGTLTTLNNFPNSSDGAFPEAGLIMDGAGNLYGTTNGGGAFGLGTVFKLSPNGTFTTLHSFNGADGENPIGGLLMDGSGNLYGTTTQGFFGSWGTVFELSPGGTLTTLHSFNGGGDGALPDAGLIADGQGNLYGTTSSGGPGGYGTVFELTGVLPPSNPAVPEPATLLLLGQGAAALLGLAWCHRRKRLAPAG